MCANKIILNPELVSETEFFVAQNYRDLRNLHEESELVAAVPGGLAAKCPAASADFAQNILGFRLPGETRVKFLDMQIGFPDVLRGMEATEELERRFRMSGPCFREKCPHWSEGCALGRVVAEVPMTESVAAPCSLSSQCRWLLENGPGVCTPCREILNLEMIGESNGDMP